MKQSKIFLSAVVLAGTCIGVAPAWSQTSSAPGGGSSPGQTDRSAKEDRDQTEVVPEKETGRQGQEGQLGGSQQGRQGGALQSEQRQGSRTGESRMKGSAGAGAYGGGQANVKKIQEALKEKGHDPGPIDGVMGEKTREAIRAFQQSNNLKVTGTIDAETAQQLGVEQAAGRGAGMGSGQRSGQKSGTSERGQAGDKSGLTGEGQAGQRSGQGAGQGR